jgi:hypothetical protein
VREQDVAAASKVVAHGSGALSQAIRHVSRRRGAERFAKHRHEATRALVPEVQRDALYGRTARHLLNGEDDVELLAPPAEAQAGLRDEHAVQSALADTDSFRPRSSSSRESLVFGHLVDEEAKPRIAWHRQAMQPVARGDGRRDHP